MKPCDHNIVRTIQISEEMIRIADRGDAEREDTGCGILYGVLRDAAYKILKLAQEEKQRHQAKGWWQEHCAGPADRSHDSLDSQDHNHQNHEEDAS